MSAPESDGTHASATPTACPWCGCSGMSAESFAELRLVLCNECDQLTPVVDAGLDEDDEMLEETGEYDAVPCGRSTF